MARLFGYGDFDTYGNYIIVAAENIEEATELIKEEEFQWFLEQMQHTKDNAQFSKLGKPQNGYANIYLYYKDKGYYDMGQDELFEAFCQNEFGKDPYHMELEWVKNKKYAVKDLNTNIWHGANS